MYTSDLGKRMKEYERRDRYYLQRRLPVICRLDMRSGHSFTKGFQRPFDDVFIKTMQETAKYLCGKIQGCKLSYQQSEEITLVLVDYDKLNTDCFFDYRVDKLCSIAASMATMAFNKAFSKNFQKWTYRNTDLNLIGAYLDAEHRGAMFDCRCFNIPKEEVTNNIYWRQLDAIRNSIQMLGQANFSHKELQYKSCKDIQDMLITEKGIDWNDLPVYQQRGSCCIKVTKIDELSISGIGIKRNFNQEVEGIVCKSRSEWIVDKNIPIFNREGREYIDKLIYIGE